MQSFREQLKAASEEEPVRVRPATRWDPILEEFRAFLNENYGTFLRASLNEAWGESAAPRVRTLRLWPRGQRNVQTTVLAVQVTPKVARVLRADAPPEFSKEEELEEYFKNFVRAEAFRERLEIFKERASQPVAGELRVRGDRSARTLDDVSVEVLPDQQFRLADASEASPPQHLEGLYVIPVASPLWGATYSRGTKPIWLVAGGYALRLDPGTDAIEPDGRVRLSGTPVPVDEL